MSRLNEQGLASEYGDLVAGFARSGILDRARLQRVGAALGAPYVLQPGLAEFGQIVSDKFELAGWKVLKTGRNHHTPNTGSIMESAGRSTPVDRSKAIDMMAPR